MVRQVPEAQSAAGATQPPANSSSSARLQRTVANRSAKATGLSRTVAPASREGADAHKNTTTTGTGVEARIRLASWGSAILERSPSTMTP